MVEFIDQERQRCRKCKSKLPVPTGNDREAFCCRGCYEQWYRKRCRACECSIEQPKTGGQRALCKRPKCKSAWKDRQPFGRFAVPKNTKPGNGTLAAELISEVVAAQHVLEPPKAVGHIIAGPRLSADAFRAATTTDNGEWQRAEARNKAALVEHFKAQRSTLGTLPINVLGGRPFRGLPRINEAGEHTGDWWAPKLDPLTLEVIGQTPPAPAYIDDCLDIPEFLRRA